MSDDLIVDLTNYKDRVGNRVMPGRYRVLVEDAEGDTAKSGNPMVNLWFRVQGGEFDGATIVDRLVLTEKSMFRVVGFMQSIGLPTPRKRLKMNVRQFIGRTLDIDVEDGEPYNGRVKSEVRGYLRVAGAQSDAAMSDGGDLDGLDEFAAATTSNGASRPVEGAAAPVTTGAAQAEAAPEESFGASSGSPEPQSAAARVDATPDVLSDDVDLADIDLG